MSETKFSNGKTSSKIPRLELIPRPAIMALASRFERGVRTKGDGAWNALTDPAACQDKQFVIDRLAHCINHCFLAIERLSGHGEPMSEEERTDGGDAGAIMFAGALLACHAIGGAMTPAAPQSPELVVSGEQNCMNCGHLASSHVSFTSTVVAGLAYRTGQCLELHLPSSMRCKCSGYVALPTAPVICVACSHPTHAPNPCASLTDSNDWCNCRTGTPRLGTGVRT